MKVSYLERILEADLKKARIRGWQREAKLIPGRRFSYDFCWPEEKLVVEIEGGTEVHNPEARGRHVRRDGFENDCRKYNLASLEGWTVLRFTSKMVREAKGGESEAIETIRRYLERRRDSGQGEAHSGAEGESQSG